MGRQSNLSKKQAIDSASQLNRTNAAKQKLNLDDNEDAAPNSKRAKLCSPIKHTAANIAASCGLIDTQNNAANAYCFNQWAYNYSNPYQIAYNPYKPFNSDFSSASNYFYNFNQFSYLN